MRLARVCAWTGFPKATRVPCKRRGSPCSYLFPRGSAVNLVEFVQKWTASTRTERAAAQEHFIDLCRLLGEPTPNEADPHGDFYAFEKGAVKVSGRDGFADVWLKDHFAWEYKGKHKNLKEAY